MRRILLTVLILGFILAAEGRSDEPLVYYAGAGWSKGGFPDSADWKTCVSDFAQRLHSPLKVQIKP
jgi:hypothetical protein